MAVVDGDGTLGPARLSSGTALAALPFRVHHDLVVDAKLALWHSREIALHHHLSGDVGRKYLSYKNFTDNIEGNESFNLS